MNKKIILIAAVIISLAVILAVWFFWPKAQTIAVDQRYYNGPTGLDIIDQALADKKIDLETALIYKIKFLFNDPTLPKEYASANGPFEDGGTFAQVQENWDKLSVETKKILEPYFLRPDNPESAISKIMNGEIKAPKVGLQLIKSAQAFDRPLSYKSDDTLVTADGKIRVWYLEKKEMIDGQEKITKLYYDVAQKVVANLNKDSAYAQFVGLLGKIPPSDGTLGGDNKIDIFIATGAHVHLADSQGGSPSQGVNVPDNGIGKSSYIILRDNLNDKYLKTTTVHELFHAFQRAFECRLFVANWWWIEGTATWSEDFIYPNDNTEQGYLESYIKKPELSLFSNGKNFEYGAYVFPFYLSNTYDRMIVTKIFEGCTGGINPLDSVDKTVDGGFKKNWKEFTLLNFNKKPVEKYKDFDKSKKFPQDSTQSGANTDMTFLSPGETSVPSKELPALTSQVVETFFSERADVKKAVFTDLKNFTGKNPNAAIKAVIYPRNNGEPYVEDWTELDQRSFCFDKPKDDFDRIVLIFSNADTKNKITASQLKVKTKESCYEINQGETLTVKPIFAISPNYVGTLKYMASGDLETKSVLDKAKYPYLGKWKVKIDYWEHFPGQSLYGIKNSPMDFFYNHYLEFDLSAESVLKDGTFSITTKEGKFETPGWTIHNEISNQTAVIPQNATMWDVPQKGVITEMTENGCKISLPDFVLYNSGGYRDLPHPIVLEIKNN